jgi:hypothetical protein
VDSRARKSNTDHTMFRFTDADGNAWDVVLGRGSWGAHVALFIPVGHAAPVRQTLLQAGAWDLAQDELETYAPDGFGELLEQSTIKDE